MKIASIVGTRPNFIKIAALVNEIRKHEMGHVLIHTGQHYDENMSSLFFDELELPKPDEYFGIQNDISADEQKNAIKAAAIAALKKHKPDLVIVVGDVNSTVAGAEAAHELGIKVAHVEAGLRSFDKTMPEEINRVRTDEISDFLFTTEKSAEENLIKEKVKGKIFFVGNVMIDTLLKHTKKAQSSKILSILGLGKNDYAVLTLHRPSNVDDKKSFEDILDILEKIQEKIKIIFPIHPRTRKNIESFNLNDKIKNMDKLIMTDPVGYLDFICLMSNSKFVLTDSGGIQEETTVLQVPCITLRNNTERPVTVEEGTNVLVSTDEDEVVDKAFDSIDGSQEARNKIPELWDGKAASRIINILLKELK